MNSVTKTKKRQHPFWIKERFNPQTGTYFVRCGQMSRTVAKRYEHPLYGSNIMHQFSTAAKAETFANDLRKKGCRVQ